MKKRRCIVPCNSFYEWMKDSKPPKTPYSFKLANGSPMGLAGLWGAWKDKDGHWLSASKEWQARNQRRQLTHVGVFFARSQSLE